MKTKATLIILAILAVFCGIYFLAVMRGEQKLRNTIEAKQEDNKSEFDNMWKKISQVAQVSEKHKDSLIEVFTSYASERGKGMQGGGGLAKWIHEAVPQADLKTFDSLQNIIVGSRDGWTMRQKELRDLKREHDNYITVPPSNIVCSILGRDKIEITIITSAKTTETFRVGQDDDVDVFKK
jgi:hypothetical protein